MFLNCSQFSYPIVECTIFQVKGTEAAILNLIFLRDIHQQSEENVLLLQNRLKRSDNVNRESGVRYYYYSV